MIKKKKTFDDDKGFKKLKHLEIWYIFPGSG